MKKIAVFLLLTATVIASCAAPTDTDDASVVESIMVESNPVEETSSDPEEEVGPVYIEIDGVSYYDVKASGAKDAVVFSDPFTGVTQGDHSEYFPEDVEGYYLDDMLFLVDKETFNRILSKPVAGTGSIKWTGFDPSANYSSNPDKFDGILPVEKMDDPLYVYMCKPADYTADLGRTHSFNMAATRPEGITDILAMAAIHATEDKPIPVEAEFTLCIGRMTLSVYTERDGWQLVQDCEVPARPEYMYYLPWTGGLGRKTLPEDKVKLVDDHYEVSLTGAEFHGLDKAAEGATGATLHFWAKRYPLEEGNDILGMVVSFECWIKEEQWSDYLLGTVGVDWKTPAGVPGGDQVNNCRAYAITTEKQVVYSHNVGPKMYDKIMDTEKVQEFIGLK